MKDYKYIQGVGFVRKIDYYLYHFAVYFFIFVILVSTFAVTITVAFALFEILKSYLVYPFTRMCYGAFILFILCVCIVIGNDIANYWIEEVKQNLRRRYHKEGV